MNLNKPQVLYILIFITFVLVSVLLTPYQLKRFFTLNSKVKALKKRIVQVNEDIKSQDKLDADKEKIRREIIDFKSKIATSTDISTLQANISKSAKRNGIEIVEINLENPKSYKANLESKFFLLPIKIALRCGFHSLGHFLNEIERGDYFLEIKNLLIQGSKPYHNVNIEILVLIKK
jgi:Tfp pilus assembly protein PilO